MANLTPSQILIVMALEQEANAELGSTGSEVLFTGVGKVNAAFQLTRKLGELRGAGAVPHLVVNFGTAGSRSFATGSVVACCQFLQADMDATGLGFALGETPFDALPRCIEFPSVFEQLPHGVCASADRFDTGHGGLPCDVIDMEAYALSRVCALERVPFACVKYVTDGADHAAAQDWAAALPRAAHAFVQLHRWLVTH